MVGRILDVYKSVEIPEELTKIGLIPLPSPNLVKCGIYFLCDKDKVVYVGKSCEVIKRYANHTDKEGVTHAFCVPVPEDKLDQEERKWINLLLPKYNNDYETQKFRGTTDKKKYEFTWMPKLRKWRKRYRKTIYYLPFADWGENLSKEESYKLALEMWEKHLETLDRPDNDDVSHQICIDFFKKRLNTNYYDEIQGYLEKIYEASTRKDSELLANLIAFPHV